MLMSLATQGVGITMLPETICAEAVRAGGLEVVLPEWRLPQGIFHAVFASRRGMLPAVRVFIDFLAEKLPGLVESRSEEHTSELQSLMRISYAVFGLKNKNTTRIAYNSR